jgi:hypothetical protein
MRRQQLLYMVARVISLPANPYNAIKWFRTFFFLVTSKSGRLESGTNCSNWKDGAGDGTRTRDVQLGKLAFYH